MGQDVTETSTTSRGSERIVRRLVFLHVLIPLIIGAIVYLLWRETSLWAFSWVALFHLDTPLNWLREAASSIHVPELVLYSLPNALWVYSLTVAMGLVWAIGGGHGCKPWIVSGLLLGCGAELLQLTPLVPGTFDPIDLAFSLFAALFGLGFLHNMRFKHALA